MVLEFEKLVKAIVAAYSKQSLDEQAAVAIAQTLSNYFDLGGNFSEINKPNDLTEEELTYAAAILNQLINFWKLRGKEASVPHWLQSISPFQKTHYLIPVKYRDLVQGKLSKECLQFNVIASKGFLTFA